jgi:LmbE family N-acetylglucosaminyl deacetylase
MADVPRLRALMLVAHPDDEVIFGAALMLAHPEYDWTLACMTYTYGSERGEHFAKSAQAFKDRGVSITQIVMLGMTDSQGAILSQREYELWRERASSLQYTQVVSEEVTLRNNQLAPDVVVTHNRLGEYGHGHHMALHAIVNEIWPELTVWNFYNQAPGSTVGPQERLPATYTTEIAGTPMQALKQQVMEAAYPEEFEVLKAAMPALMDWQFNVQESFTSDPHLVPTVEVPKFSGLDGLDVEGPTGAVRDGASS